MTTVVLSDASPRLPNLQALSIVLEDELRRRAGRTEIRTFELATMRLAYCQGEFDCWTRTPGLCRAHDAEDDIVRAIHDASELVLLDAVTFGGHSYTLKRAQDRLICLLSSFFEKRASLTHHAARYERAASLFALGWAPDSDAEVAQTWRELADANAVNMLAPRVDPSVPLDAQHGPAEHVKSALDLAAPCLASGNPIPTAAIERMAASPMPDVLYRLVGDMGWRYQAHKNGLAQAALRARPLG
jgi:hypothetical protein